MKFGKLGGVIVAVVVIGGVALIAKSATWIPDGYTGVEVSVKNGAEDKTLHRGLNFIKPTSRVKRFTTANEQLLLTKDKREGSKDDDSFKVSTSDNANISISFQMSYYFDPDRVVGTYKKFRGMDGEMIVNERVKSVLRSKVSEVTTNYSMMDIYSGNLAEINDKLTEYLNAEFFDSYGIVVEDASIISGHPDDKLQEAIDKRLKALQERDEAKTKQETAKVEAETALIKAQNEADIKVKQAEAEAKANSLKANSITPELIQMKEAEARLKHGWVTVQGVDNTVVAH